MASRVWAVTTLLFFFLSQVSCETTVLVKLLNYTVNSYGVREGTQEQRCCVTGQLLKPFICNDPCSPNVRFCVQTDPFDQDTCSSEIVTSSLTPRQFYHAGTQLGNFSNPVALTVDSWSVSARIKIRLSAHQMDYTLLLADSVHQPLIWPVPNIEPTGWRTIVDDLDKFRTVAYMYKVFETNTVTLYDVNQSADQTTSHNCTSGYTGPNCTTDIDECASGYNTTCDSESTCVNTQGSYRCFCDSTGLNDPNCEVDVDECGEKNPCKGTCINTLGSYQCMCFGRTGYTGQNCDTDIDECAADACKNSATCSNTPGSFYCSCPEGYQGPDCSQDVNECLDYLCGEVNQCENVPGGYKCICQSGYTGFSCDIDIDECADRPCYNWGTCTNYPGSFYCKCKPGFGGFNCQKVVPVKGVTSSRPPSGKASTVTHPPCTDVPGFPCNNADSSYNMCLDQTIAGRYCRKTCKRCIDFLDLIG